MTFMHPLAFLLGLEGVALLRAQAGDAGFDRAFVEARFAEIRTLLDEAAPQLGDGIEVGQVSTVDGYRSWSVHYDEPGNPLIEVEEPIVRRILAALPPGKALDAACGTGRHARYLAELGHQVTGVDSSPDMLAHARVHLPDADLREGDLHELPLPDGELDLVVCGLALTHVPALGPVLAEFARVLRPGGRLVISDVHVMSLYLGGVANATGPDGVFRLLPAGRYLASDYLAAALPVGLTPIGCEEPPWPPSPWAGGPQARQWCQQAAAAAYEATPAAIIWQFQKTAA
jgi:SAM-dependent methyltransferase